ncbi:DUF2163 domain-containing protein [Roseicitreum antarcticum]|uniref:Bacteriophage phiJL001 Gp84 C-terminal domain-containing protein n=1 Tax=Roseicitreum antarcticum TaxID=564137 RepID=A0A1H2TYU9_9RHOB|nr:DUF2163 domain-containing protein [Roseicitreum antarcticum]SDW48907.1 phage conserved hypothetical protein BR0599 [Roseicitreum antarcticum]
MTLQAHLESGATTVARVWLLTRADGVVMGFTDHDRDLHFGGVVYRAGAGLTARALEQTTGLSVDNSEAVGALSDGALTEADIRAGRYDGATLEIAEVNWAAQSQRRVVFRGTLGEVSHQGGAFRAELRGLTEALGVAGGRIYQADCTAVLGDAACRFDLSVPGYRTEAALLASDDGCVLRLPALPGFDDLWFEGGRVQVMSGAAMGQTGVIKADRVQGAARVIELWQALGALPARGDLLRLDAGCDKRAATCRLKFANMVNFQGFPHIPGEDWLMAYPRRAGANTGAALRGAAGA